MFFFKIIKDEGHEESFVSVRDYDFDWNEIVIFCENLSSFKFTRVKFVTILSLMMFSPFFYMSG